MCPRLGEMMPKGWGDNAQAVGNTSLCGLMTFPVKSVGFEKRFICL